ncbi:unnamed protein product [Fusarium graminearum]|nr:unnamed protein product [Fusarium graminearum]CAG1988618.1 unnamed protein product [Fusarium graminearum]VTO81568.1 unnamed protein product [Fusarium graminearum]
MFRIKPLTLTHHKNQLRCIPGNHETATSFVVTTTPPRVVYRKILKNLGGFSVVAPSQHPEISSQDQAWIADSKLADPNPAQSACSAREMMSIVIHDPHQDAVIQSVVLSKPGSDPWQSSMDGHRRSEPPAQRSDR